MENLEAIANDIISEEVSRVLAWVRASGKVNMLDRKGVLWLLNEAVSRFDDIEYDYESETGQELEATRADFAEALIRIHEMDRREWIAALNHMGNTL